MNNSTEVKRLMRALELNLTDYEIEREDYETGEDFYILEEFSVRLTLLILYSIVFFFCVFGNLMVLLVVITHWRMKHITKFCLANLALADLCVGVFCVFQNFSTYFINNWMLGEFLCKMYQFINGTSHTSSVLTLMAVCVERYLAILQPLRCKQILTKTRLKILVVLVWLASGLYCSPRLYYMSIVEVPRSLNGTEMEWICTARRNLYNSRTFDMINSILLFILPLILMTVLYTRVGLVLWSNVGHSSFSNPLPIPAISPHTSHANDGLSETETFGINPQDRVIEIQIGKKPEQNKTSPEASTKYHGHFDINSFHSHSSPCVFTQQKYFSPRSDSRRDSSLSSSDLDITSTSASRVQSRAEDDSPKKIVRAGKKKKQITKNVIPLKMGLNALRRKYFLKKIQAEKQLQMRKHFLGGRDELVVRRSVVKMLMVIVGAFAFCNFPFHLRKFAIYWWPVFDHGSAWGTLTLPISYLCMYGNCAINPIIYAIMSSSFRASIKDVIHCRWKKPKSSASAHNKLPCNNTLLTSPSSRSNNLTFMRNFDQSMQQV